MKNKYLNVLLAGVAALAGVASAQMTPNPVPGRVLGQLTRPSTYVESYNPSGVTPNLLEGRELFEPLSVAVDTSLDPPAVYVADTKNSRVLGWRNAAEFQNGAFADIVIGQKDFYSSAATTATLTAAYHSALGLPASVVVGPGGNLFVYDAGNNRILRFPSPFGESRTEQKADLVIGQATRIARNPNRSTSTTAAPTAATLKSSLTVTTQQSAMLSAYLATLAFDSEGNLWATDPGNHRVLRYSSTDVNGPGNIQANGAVEPEIAANRVLGQEVMTTATANPGLFANAPQGQVAYRMRKNQLRSPAALAFDSVGNLYVADDLARVLFYRNPGSFDGQPADRILGLLALQQGQAAPPPVNETTFGYRISSSNVFSEGVHAIFCINDVPFVVDSLNSRILRFDPAAEWPAENVQYSPSAKGVIGQESFYTGQPNRYSHWEPSPTSFRNPSGAVFANNEVWVADTGNNRVTAFPNFLEVGDTVEAYKLLGQVAYEYRAPNFIQGREFSGGSLTSTIALGPAAVVDRSSDPPRLYIADTGNNRILGFADARRAQSGDFADIVIGQVDFYRALVNSPTSDAVNPSETGLFLPSMVAVDKEGNLWVADTGNSRVLRYPRPFDKAGEQQLPDLVIGRESFTAAATIEVGASSMGFPSGLALSDEGQLYVSDLLYNRVLRFDPPFASGMAATVVFGQPDFETTSSGNGLDKLSFPLGLALDSGGRLFVADAGNSRIAVFSSANGELSNGVVGARPIIPTTGTISPRSIAISHLNGDIFVTDSNSGSVRRFPNYDQIQRDLVISQTIASNYSFLAAGPRNIALDASGNVLVLDSVNRMTMHYPQLVASNWESGFFRLTPGLISRVVVPGVKLAAESVVADDAPLPKDLAGVEVLVNGVPSPIYSLSEDAGSGVAKIQIPASAPISGSAEIMIRNKDTLEILGNQSQPFERASPAFMVANAPGGGQIVAYNSDGKPNLASNPAERGSVVTFKLIGYGPLDATPEDGVAAEWPVYVDGMLYVGGALACGTGGKVGLCPAEIITSTLDPVTPGVWLIKARLNPNVTGAAAGNFAVGAALYYRDRWSSTYYIGGKDVTISATIAIRP
jgi:uncharacterized protein (TIGR03437 family)